MAKAKKEAKAPAAPKETREELNARARYDYGIINAEDMQESQVRDEIAAIDKQAEEGRKANEAAAKEAAKSGQTPSTGTPTGTV